MNINPLISIIVPIYNVEKYLDRCISSISNQTYKNIEIILVDDGSPDNSYLIYNDWMKKDNRIKVIKKKNGGLSDARNAGLKVANGEYIGFVDSDDWIDSKMYEALINVINKENSDIACCKFRKVWDEDKSIIYENIGANNILTFETEEAMSLLIDDKIEQVVWNKLYKFEVVKGIEFNVGKYHEDVFWSYKIIGNAKKVSIIDNEYYNYFQRSNSIMGEKYTLKRLDVLEAHEQRCEYMKKNFNMLYKKALISYISSCMYNYQCVSRNKNLYSTDKDLCKFNIINRIKKIRKEKFSIKSVGTIKQYIWIKSFIFCPNIVCTLRNILKIGL